MASADGRPGRRLRNELDTRKRRGQFGPQEERNKVVIEGEHGGTGSMCARV